MENPGIEKPGIENPGINKNRIETPGMENPLLAHMSFKLQAVQIYSCSRGYWFCATNHYAPPFHQREIHLSILIMFELGDTGVLHFTMSITH